MSQDSQGYPDEGADVPGPPTWPDPNADTVGSEALLERLLAVARGLQWAWYQRRGRLRLVEQGQPEQPWPAILEEVELQGWCSRHGVLCYPTGGGARPLGYLLGTDHGLAGGWYADLALRLGFVLQQDQLQRAQAIQQVLFDITYLASSTRDLQVFMAGVHALLRPLIDAENLGLALGDPLKQTLRFPYYFDSWDQQLLDPDSRDAIDGLRPTLTAYVLLSGQPLQLDRRGIEMALRDGPYYCEGRVPEFWMGMPLKDGTDHTFGVLSLHVYDEEHRYDADEQRLFEVIARDVAMALDRILRREDLEATVAQRTQELSEVNARLREQVRERERAEHLQKALFRIAELSSGSADMDELFRGLHQVMEELLYARNFYIALYDEANDLVSFPYFADELLTALPAARHGKRGYTEYTIRQRRPCLIDRETARQLIGAGEIIPVEGTPEASSWLGIPLFEGGQVRGVLVVQSYRDEVRYTLRDQELLTFVSRHVDTALTRRSTAQAVRLANQALELRVRERTRLLDAANARLVYENTHDGLTRLANRNFLLQRLDELWLGLQQGESGFAVMFLDLDRFKLVNDRFGHAFGDLLLTAAAERLSSCLREGDLLARLGGDEFAILVSSDILDAPVAIARRIIEAFDQPLLIGEYSLFASCSIGIALADLALHSRPDELLRDADTAMYRIKQGGRDNFGVFNQEVRRAVSDQVMREGALREALKANDQLEPFFQPIIELATGRIAALEALIRWRQPNGGLLAPGSFLPELEGLRLIGRLDSYMLDRVAALLALPEHAHWPVVHVNCSSYSMVRPDFADEVLAILARHGVAASRISLELTEGALVAEPERARATMEALDRQGVSVVLDDFGAGFSSLGYVHQYRFSGLKIDKSFVLKLAEDPRSAAIVRAIVLMADALGLEVVAEGVENLESLRLLEDIGARLAQGYHFARPMDVAATRSLLSGPMG